VSHYQTASGEHRAWLCRHLLEKLRDRRFAHLAHGGGVGHRNRLVGSVALVAPYFYAGLDRLSPSRDEVLALRVCAGFFDSFWGASPGFLHTVSQTSKVAQVRARVHSLHPREMASPELIHTLASM